MCVCSVVLALVGNASVLLRTVVAVCVARVLVLRIRVCARWVCVVRDCLSCGCPYVG